MKHKTRMIIIAVIVFAFAFVAYRAEAAVILKPVRVQCIMCYSKAPHPSTIMPVVVEETPERVVNTSPFIA